MGQTNQTTPDLNAFAGNYGAARGFDSAGTNMLGDFIVGGSFGSNGGIAVSNIITVTRTAYSITSATVTTTTSTTTATTSYGNGRATVPFVTHTYKAAENESPWARTRLILNTNYYAGIGGDTTSITRQIFGFELANAEGRASLGIRAPLYTVDPGVQTSQYYTGGSIGTFGTETGNSTAFGDLITNFKYSLLYDPAGGNVFSIGTIFTANTGPSTFGGVTPFYNVNGIQHVATIQPYAAFYRSFSPPGTSGAFLQGFFASDTPFNENDSTLLYTDLAIGYIFRTAPTYSRTWYDPTVGTVSRSRTSWITAIIPTFEIHSNNFLNKRDYSVSPGPGFAQSVRPSSTNTVGTDPTTALGVTTTTVSAATIAGTMSYHDQFNLTTGVTMILNGRSALAFGVVTPVMGPNPYNYELQLSFNTYLGSPGAPPPYRR